VEKRYEGLGAIERAVRETVCLSHLAELLPVPAVIDRDLSSKAVTLGLVRGVHGQDRIDAGHARDVLGLLGSLAGRLQSLAVDAVPGLPGDGSVIVHGDFGPQNVLIDGGEVSALLDWEFAHVGEPVEDPAWAEWIVRMHHPDHHDSLTVLYESAGVNFTWTQRQASMVLRCEALLDDAERTGSPDLTATWRSRLRTTQRWRE